MRSITFALALAAFASPLFAQRKLEQPPLDAQQQEQLKDGATVRQKPGDAAPIQAKGGQKVDRKAPAEPRAVPVDEKVAPNQRAGDKRAPGVDVANVRKIAKQMHTMEKRHREILSRLARVEELYLQAGQDEKLNELEDLRTRWQTRYERAMNGFRDSIGPEMFGKIRAAMGGEVLVPRAAPNTNRGRGGLDQPEAPAGGEQPQKQRGERRGRG